MISFIVIFEIFILIILLVTKEFCGFIIQQYNPGLAELNLYVF